MDVDDADFTPPKRRRRLLDPTSDGVAQPTLESLRLRESELRTILKKIESVARPYRIELKEINDKIERRHVPHIQKLPIELLTMIFRFLVAISPDDIARVYSVCRMWQTLSRRSPELWSTIIVSRDDYAFMKKVELYWDRSLPLEKSLPHSLRVSYTQSIRLSRLRWQVWEALMSISPRIITFTVTFDDCMSASYLIPSIEGCSSLQELSVSIRRQSQQQGYEGKFGFEKFHAGKTPSLRSLTISTHILPEPPSLLFSKLTQLQVTDTFYRLELPMNNIEPIRGQHILDFLLFCPNLEEFCFDGEKSSGRVLRRDLRPHISSDVRLRNLRRLRLMCHYTVAFTVLSGIVAPNVEDVVLRIFPRYRFEEDEPSITAGEFLARCPKIRTLWLYGLNPKALFCPWSARLSLQLLERLHLEHVAGLNTIANRLCTMPQLGAYTDVFWFLPRLSTLSIVANVWDVPFDLFADVIKTRYQQSTSSEPATIQKYVVNDQNLLAADGEVAAYSRPIRFPWNPEPRVID